MLTFKFLKTGNARFISHIELLRQMSRILRRAGISVKYSQGYNPHALVFFSPPGVLGVASTAEYVSIDTEMPQEEAFMRFNDSVPEYLKALKYYYTDTNPNLPGKITAADYVFPTPYFAFNKTEFCVTYEKKGETVTETAADKIFAVFDAEGKLGMRLAAGNFNLRPDRVISALKRYHGLDIPLVETIKTAQYVEEIEVGEYLERLTLK